MSSVGKRLISSWSSLSRKCIYTILVQIAFRTENWVNGGKIYRDLQSPTANRNGKGSRVFRSLWLLLRRLCLGKKLTGSVLLHACTRVHVLSFIMTLYWLIVVTMSSKRLRLATPDPGPTACPRVRDQGPVKGSTPSNRACMQVLRILNNVYYITG